MLHTHIVSITDFFFNITKIEKDLFSIHNDTRGDLGCKIISFRFVRKIGVDIRGIHHSIHYPTKFWYKKLIEWNKIPLKFTNQQDTLYSTCSIAKKDKKVLNFIDINIRF